MTRIFEWLFGEDLKRMDVIRATARRYDEPMKHMEPDYGRILYDLWRETIYGKHQPHWTMIPEWMREEWRKIANGLLDKYNDGMSE